MFLRKTFLVLTLLSIVLAAVPVGAAGPGVGQTAGKSYGEWAARWWQWLATIPAAESPQTAQGAIDCSVSQDGPVWFLAGAPSGLTAERSCTVPGSKPLFFPAFNAIFTNGPGEDFSVAAKRDILEGFLSDTEPGFLADFGFPGSRACEVFATIDGLPVTYFVPDARTQSPSFAIDTREGRAGLPAGVVDPEAVTDGFWVLLPPLTPGEHELRFGGRLCQIDNFQDHPLFGPVDVTYHLSVTSGTPATEAQPSNLEIVQSLYAAFAAGDGETILAILHPDVIWIESEGIPYGGTFFGRDAVFEGVFNKIAAEWDGFTAEVDELLVATDGRVISLGRDSGTYKATGKSMTAPTASFWTLNDEGQVIEFRQYIDTLAVMGAVNP